MGKFIKQLTDSELENFLKNNKYALCNTLKDSDGKLLPAIERSDDMIFVRCQRILDKNEKEIDEHLAYALMRKFPGFLSLSMLSRCGEYSSDINLISFSDFYANLFCVTLQDHNRAETLHENYVNFMYAKFKNQNYKEEYLADWNTLAKSESETEM